MAGLLETSGYPASTGGAQAIDGVKSSIWEWPSLNLQVNATAATIPAAAAVKADGIPIAVATCPHRTLPSPIPPMNTTMNAASPPARTHSGNVKLAETCSAERIEIQTTTVARNA